MTIEALIDLKFVDLFQQCMLEYTFPTLGKEGAADVQSIDVSSFYGYPVDGKKPDVRWIWWTLFALVLVLLAAGGLYIVFKNLRLKKSARLGLSDNDY